MHKSDGEQSYPDADFDYSGDQISRAGRVEEIRQKITDEAGDQPAILGTTSDAALIALDHLSMDILAIDRSATSSYKTARIELYEEWHGDDKWALAVADANKWFQGRKAGVIKSPVDVKGQRALESIAKRSTAVAEVLAEAQSAT